MKMFLALVFLVSSALAQQPVPKVVHVGHTTYTVIVRPDTFPCGSVKVADGCTTYSEQTIEVKSGPLEYSKYVILHEVLHAAAFYGGNEMSSGGDEVWASAFGNPLLAIMEDNPDLVAYLTQK